MRGCASELGNYLGPNYQVTGTFMPGSRLQNVTKLARKETADFSKEDMIIIWGGSNDVNRNESMKGPMNLNEFVDQRNNTHIMIAQIPHRHDLLATSCINEEVQNFNKKLQKIMKCKDNVRILNYKPTREDITQHGLHLNASGKAKVAKLMSQNISPLSENRKKHPIILKWITTLHVNNVPEVLNEEYVVLGNEGGNDEQIDSTIQGIETTSLCNEGGDDDQIHSTIQGIETTNTANGIPKGMKEEQVLIKNKERNEDQMVCENQGNRVSARPKRSDDFLWTLKMISLFVKIWLL
jgi:lysophospholipase L1-like esterase